MERENKRVYDQSDPDTWKLHPDIHSTGKVNDKNMNDTSLWFSHSFYGRYGPIAQGPGGAYYAFKTEEEARIQLEKLKEEFGSKDHFFEIIQKNVLCNNEYYYDKYHNLQKIGKRVID